MSYASQGTVTFAAASGSTQTDITLAFTASDASLKSFANGGRIKNTTTRVGITVPCDFVLTTDSTGATITGFTWGIESWNASTGVLVGWVMISSLTTSASVTAYAFWGNSAISTYQGGAQGAEFDLHTVAVYHWGQPLISNLSLAGTDDASSNSNNLGGFFVHSPPAPVAGIVDGAGNFTGGEVAQTTSTTGLPSGSSPRTLEMWFKFQGGGPTSAQELGGYGDGATTGARWAVYYDGTGKLYMNCGIIGSFITWTYDTNWHHVAFTLPSGSTTSSILGYLDGVQQTLTALPGGISTVTTAIGFGSIVDNYGFDYFDGYMDETRIVAAARSADWIATEYANQLSPPALASITTAGGSAARSFGFFID